jgi:hypothetical protein
VLESLEREAQPHFVAIGVERQAGRTTEGSAQVKHRAVDRPRELASVRWCVTRGASRLRGVCTAAADGRARACAPWLAIVRQCQHAAEKVDDALLEFERISGRGIGRVDEEPALLQIGRGIGACMREADRRSSSAAAGS